VTGPGKKFFTQVGSGQFFVAQVGVSHLWFGFEFGKLPLKMSDFSIFFSPGQKNSLWVESKAGRPLIYCGSKVSLDWVRSGPIPSVSTPLKN